MRPRKQNRQQDILFILISSFVLVIIWIGFNIYHIYITSTISEEIQLQLDPIDGSFDQATIKKLRTREQINPLYQLASSSATAQPTPEPTVTDTTAPEPTTPAPSIPAVSPGVVSPSPVTSLAPSPSGFDIQGQ